VPFSCQEGGMGVEMRVLVRIPPSPCSQIESNHTHQRKIRGVEVLRCKD